jgi:iron complex outermembrane recepter protein
MRIALRLLAGTVLAGSGLGLAAAQAPAPATPAAVPAEEVVVLGRGQSRQVQTIRGSEMRREAPGASPIKLVERLPGVAFTAADPFGAYEWAVRINIRGFNQNQLGFTLNGVPLGDMSYGNHNGLHISRALISENLDRAVLAQGAGALEVASSSNLGGTLQFFSRAPEDEAMIAAAVTAGSENTLRGYVRLETGKIGGLGLKGSVSYVNSRMDKWKGLGEQNQEQLNARFEIPVGKGTLTAWTNWSKRRENDYQDLSLEMITRLGRDFDNISDNWALAVRIADIAHNRGDTGAAVTNAGAGTAYPAPIRTVDDAYFDASGLRDDLLSAVQLDLPVNDAITFNATVYSHQNEGQGLWFTPYVLSPLATTPGATNSNAPLSVRTTEYDINRVGFIGGVTAIAGTHTINAGVWYETNEFAQSRRFYALDRAAPNRGSLDMLNGPFFTQWSYVFDTTTLKIHIQDTWKVTDRFTLNFGFKGISVENKVQTLAINSAPPVPGSTANLVATIKSEDWFLPQVSALYEIDDNNQVFAGYAENISAYVSAATAGPFASRNQLNVNEVNRTLRPESSRTFELGFRTRGARYQASIAAYYVQFEDRLLGIAQGPGIVGNAPILSNVGGVRTLGLELAGTYDITESLRLFASYTYNDSKYQDDVVNRNGVVLARTGDKRVVNTPENLFKADVTYDDGALSGGLSVSYTGDRFYTFENIGGLVDGFTTVDLNLGYRIDTGTPMGMVEAQLNVTNLFDEDGVSTIGTNGFVNSDPTGAFQTLMVNAPRQAFFTLRVSY